MASLFAACKQMKKRKFEFTNSIHEKKTEYLLEIKLPSTLGMYRVVNTETNRKPYNDY